VGTLGDAVSKQKITIGSKSKTKERKGSDHEIYNSQRSPVKTASIGHRRGRTTANPTGLIELVDKSGCKRLVVDWDGS
jgi:hypothetical protein